MTADSRRFIVLLPTPFTCRRRPALHRCEEYYSTLFHELSHSTGHSSRLDRKLDTDPKPFGSSDYGKEELVAEMSAAFLCSHAGIQPAVIGNQAAYLAGWLKQIKSDKKLVISAAGQAQRCRRLDSR